MRFLFLLLAQTLAGSSVFAACGENAPLSVTQWEATKENEATTLFALTMESKLPKPTRIVSGYIDFTDALGEHMGAIAIPRDEPVPASSSFELDLKIGSLVVPRILKINRDDVAVRACVEAVVYEDGSKEEFK
jgi:hypothetical protein